VKVLFASSRTPISWAIRFITWSKFSHTALLTTDGTVIEARFPKVREVSLDEFLRDNGTVVAVDVPCHMPGEATKWARSQVGHAYDWSALFGFVFHRNWAHTGEWWCSELVAMAREKGLSPWFRNDAINRITPQHIWQMPGKVLPKLKG
jgi:uncharacterized protein YycO